MNVSLCLSPGRLGVFKLVCVPVSELSFFSRSSLRSTSWIVLIARPNGLMPAPVTGVRTVDGRSLFDERDDELGVSFRRCNAWSASAKC